MKSKKKVNETLNQTPNEALNKTRNETLNEVSNETLNESLKNLKRPNWEVGMPKYDKYHAKWKANMAKCSKYHAKCKLTMPKCSKYHAKWQVLVPNCCNTRQMVPGKNAKKKIQTWGKKNKNYSTSFLYYCWGGTEIWVDFTEFCPENMRGVVVLV